MNNLESIIKFLLVLIVTYFIYKNFIETKEGFQLSDTTAEKLKVKRDVIGDFTKGINDLIDSVFKADYKEGEYGIDDYIDQDVDPEEIASITGANLKDILDQIKDAKNEN